MKNIFHIQKNEDLSKQSAFKKMPVQQTEAIVTDQKIGVTNQMMNVINAQNILIMKLLQKQNLLYQELNKRLSSSDSGSRSPINQIINREVNPHKRGQENFQYNYPFSDSSQGSKQNGTNKPQIQIIQLIENHETLQKNVQIYRPADQNQNQNMQNNQEQDFIFLEERSSYKIQKNKNKNKNKNYQEDDFIFPEDQRSSHKMEKKQTETKNMIKNFAKAIFKFIQKNKDKRTSVLNNLGIAEEQFMQTFSEIKGKIHSLSELRSLWTIDGNIYNKAFRILSSLYLRKYCLQKTFNSRIQNYGIHMKYRQRLIQGISDPQSFTVLKTN